MSDFSNDRQQLRRIEALFHDALALPAGQREAFMRGHCGDDAAMLEELRSLVRASDEETRVGQRRVTAARAAADVASRGRRVGPYEIDRLLGRGGMGSVYLAHRADGQFVQKIAIKLIDLPLTSNLFRERFRVERQILADLVHPFIARLLDGGMTETGEMYLAMEYVDGISITDYCQKHALSLRQRLQSFLNVCSAVQFAHQNLVVHRDLKPDNILIAADGTPRLLDFGTAKLLMPLSDDMAAGFTQHGMQPFTPNFASPEQVLGEPITTASDTYSLGVLLYLMLAEVPPYSMREFTTSEFLRVVCAEEPIAPSAAAAAASVPRRLDADLDAIILKALRKEPQRRYASVEQFAADVQAYLNGRPVSARRGTLRYRCGKFVRRNRLPLAIAGLLVLSVIGGGVAVMWQSREANEQRQRALARSEDLRQLSGSLLSEIDEAIKELPGSTPVQRLLVDRVLHHLDRMSKEADDRVTSLDLSAAYTRLGNLQGNPYEQNIGDPDGALSSLEKAIHWAAALKAQDPRDAQALTALARAEQAHGEVLFGVGRTQDAVRYMRSAVTDYAARDTLPDTGSHELADAASAVGALGDLLGQSGVSSLGDAKGALDAYGEAMALSERALSAEPGFVRAQRGIAIDHLKIGNIRLATDPRRATEEYVRSLQAWQALPTSDQSSASTRRGIAQTHLKIAMAAAALDDYDRANREMELAQPTLEYLAKADADDSRVTYDLAGFYQARAVMDLDMLDSGAPKGRAEIQRLARRAAEQLNRALPILMKLVSLEPANRSWLATQAYQQVLLGDLEQTYLDAAEGSQRTATGYATLMSEAKLPQANVDVLEMATLAGLSLPKALRNTQATVACAQRLVAGHSSPGSQAPVVVGQGTASRRAACGSQRGCERGAGVAAGAGGGQSPTAESTVESGSAQFLTRAHRLEDP